MVQLPTSNTSRLTLRIHTADLTTVGYSALQHGVAASPCSPIHSLCSNTCCCRIGYSNVFAELRPRFPLYGGWKTEFTFGYSLPLSAVLTKGKGGNQLEASFTSSFDRIVVDDLTVKVTTPTISSLVVLPHPNCQSVFQQLPPPPLTAFSCMTSLSLH